MRLGERIEGLPRLALLDGPTPLQRAANLSRLLGVELYLKRDDVGTVGGGGGKLRKLEWLLGDARAAGATAIITSGTEQSNHARLTAAACARAGLKAHLCLRGTGPPDPGRGNLLMGRLYGATAHFVGDRIGDAAWREMERRAAELEAQGEVVTVIPSGGASALGTLGYVLGFEELLGQCLQCHLMPEFVVISCGTGSSYAGLLLGARLLHRRTRVIGFSSGRPRTRLEPEIERLIVETAELLGLAAPPPPDPAPWLEDGCVGPGHGQASESGQAALLLMARAEGVLLDTTYTAKAFAGLGGAVARGVIPRGSTVVFVHTGGSPELFARDPAELPSL